MGCDPLQDPAKPCTPRTGVGLRSPHVREIIETRPNLDFFELLTDNHLCDGGYARQQAYLIREHYLVSLHCVGMSLGGTDPLDFSYLGKIKTLARELEPMHISDHLCWTSYRSHHAHDLLPLPYTEEAVHHVSRRIRDIQDYLETPLVVENVSSYLEFAASDLNEWEFLAAVAEAVRQPDPAGPEQHPREPLQPNGTDAGEYIREHSGSTKWPKSILQGLSTRASTCSMPTTTGYPSPSGNCTGRSRKRPCPSRH